MENQKRLRASMDYQLALLIAMGVNAPDTLPRCAEEAYPGVFGKQAKEKPVEEWREIKARVAAHGVAYAIKHQGGEDF